MQLSLHKLRSHTFVFPFPEQDITLALELKNPTIKPFFASILATQRKQRELSLGELTATSEVPQMTKLRKQDSETVHKSRLAVYVQHVQ